MTQTVDWYLALNSGFGGCQIVLIHVCGGYPIVLIRLKLGVSAIQRLLTLLSFVDWFIPTLALRGMHQILCTESAFCVRTVRERARNGDRVQVSD